MDLRALWMASTAIALAAGGGAVAAEAEGGFCCPPPLAPPAAPFTGLPRLSKLTRCARPPMGPLFELGCGLAADALTAAAVVVLPA
eukprot:CAMPEP_0202411492 /NCGR_PEP_ID=MMETSP1128-20130828/22077_1 /ASSEMBLY_ACC=CAM_ASM_000463 /TAXON_ID=3047 /ORGANISM="Dunaliella tertiolecta, Strain CCMP1320" /LENGTH=85 /DNA_ID=CAMNT_0049017213 /DNA_START=956 /DNA_END=1210 /DNA_ORIENTATION=-